MGRALGAIDEHDGSGRVCAGHDALERKNRSERVAHVRTRYELAAVEQLVEVVEHIETAVVDRNKSQLGAAALREKLPGHEVRVVFEFRQ